MERRERRLCWVLAVLAGVGSGCRCADDAGRDNVSGGDDPSAKSGYGSAVEPHDFQLSAEEKQALLVLARSSVETWVRSQKPVDTAELTRRFPKLSTQRACFVTLRREGQLRGCIGSLEPRRPLAEDVQHNAVSAAIHDTRFQPVEESELSSLRYSISVLDLPRPLQGVTAADLPAYMGRHRPGVIIEYRGRRSTFLPSVWEELTDPESFLSRLCLKQGSPSDCWKESDVRISTYGSIYFAEEDGH